MRRRQQRDVARTWHERIARQTREQVGQDARVREHHELGVRRRPRARQHARRPLQHAVRRKLGALVQLRAHRRPQGHSQPLGPRGQHRDGYALGVGVTHEHNAPACTRAQAEPRLAHELGQTCVRRHAAVRPLKRHSLAELLGPALGNLRKACKPEHGIVGVRRANNRRQGLFHAAPYSRTSWARRSRKRSRVMASTWQS